jgi:hypothetical protein
MESLVNRWTFIIMLLGMSLSCFVISAANIHDRLQLSLYGVPATIERASQIQTLPLDWSSYSGRASFFVKVRSDEGKNSSAELFLSKEVIEALLRNEKKQIIFAEDNPRRFIMKGEPFPPFEFGWLGSGVLFGVLFLYALKLRQVDAEKIELIHLLADLNALSPNLAVVASQISDSVLQSAFRSLKKCGIIKETATGLIYLDESQLNQAAGVSNKFIVISILTTFVIMFFLFWLQFSA